MRRRKRRTSEREREKEKAEVEGIRDKKREGKKSKKNSARWR